MQHKGHCIGSKPLYTLKDFTSASEEPSHLVVLVHGLHGSSKDFLFLEKSLLQLDKTQSLVVFRPSVNEGRTTDGICKGGSRLAEAVRAFCSKYPSLRSISFVGFSLGGLYVRYALFLLMDKCSPEKSLICGLKPYNILLVASPNLGVSGFGPFRYLPRVLQMAIVTFLGETIRELFLFDRKKFDGRVPLLWAMTDDAFISAIAQFPRRFLFANIRYDVEVPYGTAALQPAIRHVLNSSIQAESSVSVKRTPNISIWKKYLECSSGSSWRSVPFSFGKYLSTQRVMKLEELMASRLRSIDWYLFEVDFGSFLPPVHDSIVAVSRNSMFERVFRKGKDAVEVISHLIVKEETVS
ncbi:Putative lipase [Galdieria sulphuraria]|nr:Putative lipase [Galdieria sulphuraria]